MRGSIEPASSSLTQGEAALLRGIIPIQYRDHKEIWWNEKNTFLKSRRGLVFLISEQLLQLAYRTLLGESIHRLSCLDGSLNGIKTSL